MIYKLLRQSLLILLFLSAMGASGFSLNQNPSSSPAPLPQDPDKEDRARDFGSPEAEMRAKLTIKADKKDYEENLARAREVSDLATQVLHSYEASKSITSEDSKKLVRLEKLTKRIRNEAGGSESDVDLHDLPDSRDDAVKRIAGFAEELKKLVEKTPRRVVSAAVIDQANKIIGVIQYMRTRIP